MITIAYVILLTIIFLFLISIIISFMGVPYAPTPKHIFKVLDEQNLIKDDQYIIELGAGDAQFLRYFYKRHNIKGIGYEISPTFYFISNVEILIQSFFVKRSNKIIVLLKSFFKADFENADVVYCYLFPSALKKLKSQFDKMKKGSLIISYDFKLPYRDATKIIDISSSKKIFIYQN